MDDESLDDGNDNDRVSRPRRAGRVSCDIEVVDDARIWRLKTLGFEI